MIRGDFRILYIIQGGQFVPIGCLTGNSMDESVAQLPTTTRDNAGWRTFRPTTQGYSINFSGLQTTDSGVLSYSALKDLKRTKTLVTWKLEHTLEGMADYGTGYITNLSENADVGDFLTFDGVLEGSGQPVPLTDNTAPTAPLLGIGVISEVNGVWDSIKFGWSGATDDIAVTGYEFRITGSDGSENIYTTSIQFFLFVGFAQGMTYSFNVRAFDIGGNRSPWSNKRLVTVPIPSAPESQQDTILFQDGIVMNDQTVETLIFT